MISAGPILSQADIDVYTWVFLAGVIILIVVVSLAKLSDRQKKKDEQDIHKHGD